MNGVKKEDVLFYEEVKPTFESVVDIANKWRVEAVNWVKQNQPKYIHENQIHSAVENMEQMILQSFYKDTNKQRMTNLHHSVEYVINSIISGIEAAP